VDKKVRWGFGGGQAVRLGEIDSLAGLPGRA